MSWLFGRRRREQELDEEIRAHFRMAVEERVARGEPREEAERAARREFGDEVPLLAVGLLLVGVSVAAAAIPLRRATRVSPVVVLSE